MTIYHHENSHDEMILLIWFVVIDDSQNDDRDTHTRVDNDCTSSVHDDSSKPFVIVLS